MIVYYARCSTVEQNEGRQLAAAEEVHAEKIYLDKVSGKNQNRPELQAMMEFVRQGDVVYVSDFSRLARNTRDLLELVERLQQKGVDFISLKESVDTRTPQGKFMLTVFGAMAELERETILSRQKEGIALAKSQGKYKGRKPIQLDDDKFRQICRRWQAGEVSAAAVARKFEISTQTFYRRIAKLGIKKGG